MLLLLCLVISCVASHLAHSSAAMLSNSSSLVYTALACCVVQPRVSCATVSCENAGRARGGFSGLPVVGFVVPYRTGFRSRVVPFVRASAEISSCACVLPGRSMGKMDLLGPSMLPLLAVVCAVLPREVLFSYFPQKTHLREFLGSHGACCPATARTRLADAQMHHCLVVGGAGVRWCKHGLVHRGEQQVAVVLFVRSAGTY